MKKIRVAYTNKGRILAIGRASSLPSILETDEIIVRNWYYNQPQRLESFLKKEPEKTQELQQAFAYWVRNKTFGLKEDQSEYRTFKGELKEYDEYLFKSLRSTAGKIGENIYHFLNPKPEKINEQIKEFHKQCKETFGIPYG